jgi:hypothetical protein
MNPVLVSLDMAIQTWMGAMFVGGGISDTHHLPSKKVRPSQRNGRV